MTEIAIAIPLRGGRDVLLRRRSERGSLAGTFEFPGGKIEAGEAPLEGAVRELEEETGLRGGAWEPLLVHAHAYPDRSVRLHAFLVMDPQGAPDPSWAWVPLTSLSDLPLPAANGPIVHALRLRLR